MKKNIRAAALLLTATIATTSCERRPLEEAYRTALVPVSIDWSEAGLDPTNDPNKDVQGASVWLFTQDGSAAFSGKSYREFKLSNPYGGEIEVPVGKYSVLIFNNTISDYTGHVGFRGTDRYDTFEYFAQAETRKRMRSTGDNLMQEPDLLAAWHLDHLEVDYNMVTYSRTSDTRAENQIRSLLNVRPQLLTPKVHVLVHVQNLAAATSAASALTGMGTSVFLATGFTAPPAGTYVFALNNRQLEAPDNRHGTVEARFNSFGPLTHASDARYTLQVDFTLRAPYEGSTTYPTPPAGPYTFDVTEQISQNQMQLQINLNIGLEIGQEIVLPDLKSSGGFGIGISDWENSIDVPIN